jgi:hypothetical protein
LLWRPAVLRREWVLNARQVQARGLANAAVLVHRLRAEFIAFVRTSPVCELRVMLPEMSYNVGPHLSDRADLLMGNPKRRDVPHPSRCSATPMRRALATRCSPASQDKPCHSVKVI